MAEFMRDRLVYTVFHSEAEDAADQLMKSWFDAMGDQVAAQFEDGIIPDDYMADIRRQADDTVATVADDHAYFVIAPSGRIEIVSALDITAGWEEFDGESGDIFQEIVVKRATQVAKGYTPEHDDEHGGDHLLNIAKSYLWAQEGDSAQDVRGRAMDAIGTLVALVELIDRAERKAVSDAVKDALAEALGGIEDPFNEDTDHGGFEDH